MNKTTYTATKGFLKFQANSIEMAKNCPWLKDEASIISTMKIKATELEKDGYTIVWTTEEVISDDGGFYDVGGMTYDEVRFNSRGD